MTRAEIKAASEARLKQIFEWFLHPAHQEVTMHNMSEHWDCSPSMAELFFRKLVARGLISYTKRQEIIKERGLRCFRRVHYIVKPLVRVFPASGPLPTPKPLVWVEKPYYGVEAVYQARWVAGLPAFLRNLPPLPKATPPESEPVVPVRKPRAFKKFPALPTNPKQRLLLYMSESPKGLDSNKKLAQIIGRSVSRTKAIISEFRREGKIDSIVQKHFLPNYQAWSNQRVYWTK